MSRHNDPAALAGMLEEVVAAPASVDPPVALQAGHNLAGIGFNVGHRHQKYANICAKKLMTVNIRCPPCCAFGRPGRPFASSVRRP